VGAITILTGAGFLLSSNGSDPSIAGLNRGFEVAACWGVAVFMMPFKT
jgi:hypothetical protein